MRVQGHAGFWSIAAVGLLLAGGVWAQEIEPEGIDADIGGGRWSGHVRGAGFYTDNFFYQPDAVQSAYGWLLNPELSYLTETARTRVTFRADGEYGTFDVPGTADDYLDGNAGLRASFQASTRNSLELTLGGKHGHDPLGIDRTEVVSPSATVELDEWNQAEAGGRYRFGTTGAILNAELGASGLRRHYVTNRSATQFLDYNTNTIDSALYYNYSPKTSALVDFSRTDYEFEYPFAGADDRSGELYRSRIGVRWLATAKSSGDIRVGYRHRTFESRETFEAIDWQAGVEWRPVWPALIKLDTGRTEQPSYLSGVRSIDVQFASAQWQQPWTARLKSVLGISASQLDYLGNGRRDDFYRGHLDLEYRLTRYAVAVTNLTAANRDSTAAAREFDRFSSFVGIQVGL